MMTSTNPQMKPRDLAALLARIPEHALNDRSLIERAYYRAEEAHRGQTRKSGEPYFTHCVAVANILAEMHLDAETLAAGLMHDIVEDTAVTLEEIQREFGPIVARMVDVVTKLEHLPKKPGDDGENRRTAAIRRSREYVRRMLLAMDDDVRVVLVKLADRLHNMRTLGYMRPDKQQTIARETMEIYAPLANRLGIWQFKWELEDLSFSYLNPDAYNAIVRKLDDRRADREAYVQRTATRLKGELAKYGITDVTITSRHKHITSIYRKMRRKDIPLEQVYDVRAVRVIVPEVTQCYVVLGIVHNLWRPISGEFDDYIANPKDNFYRSLHTAVIDENGKTLEVQIRTPDMHEHAEYGIAAHWRYKEGNQGNDRAYEERIAYLRRLMEFRESSDSDMEDFFDKIQQEVFQARIYVFTPKGDIVDLPAGATPLDFAYHIHTEIGHSCRGARVNGKIVPLIYELKMSDQVEIITTKQGRPSLDWLNSEAGYVRTSRAREKIRHYFRRQDRDKHIQLGRELLEREMKRLGALERISFDALALMLGLDAVDDLLAAIGSGDITGNQIAGKVLEEEHRKQEVAQIERELAKPRPAIQTPLKGGNTITVAGASGMMVNLARCCHPMVGDEIIGYVTRGHGITVHRRECSNVSNIPDPERLIDVSWGSERGQQCFTVPLELLGYDREGLLSDVSTLISGMHLNITNVSVVTRQQIAVLYLSVDVPDAQALQRLLIKLEGVQSIVEARRRYQAAEVVRQ